MAGQRVPTHDALQLRNWANNPEDAMLPLEEIARRILESGAKESGYPSAAVG